MAEQSANDSCEEPDAEFFDTFFDDEDFETIGEVLGDKKNDNENDDSSCEELYRNTDSRSSDNVQTEGSISHGKEDNRFSSRKESQIDKGLHLSTGKDEIVPRTEDNQKTPSVDELLAKVQRFLKDAPVSELIVDKSKQAESHDSAVQETEKKELVSLVRKSLAELPALKVDANKISEPDCNECQGHSSKNNTEKENDLVLEDNLTKKESPQSSPGKMNKINIKLKRDIEKDKSGPSEKSSESAIHAVDLDCKIDELTSTNQNKIETLCASEKVIERAIPAVEEKGREQIDNGIIQSSCSSSIPNASLAQTSSKSTCNDTETKTSKDDTEKENDLVLEDNLTKKDSFQSPSGKKNKINLNLKTQILASTTILNSGSSKPEVPSSGTKRGSTVPKKSLLHVCSPVSSDNSDDPLWEKKKSGRKKISKKRKRNKSTNREPELSDHERKKSKFLEKSEKLTGRNKSVVSPEPRRNRDNKKSSTTRRRRSRSRSASHTSKRLSRREKSPYRGMRLNRRRTFSRSPSPSSRRYMKRSRSPFRHRSRSRSRSYSPYQMRKSPSPSTRRRRKSRSRSPFINEIHRLKKQWDIEDRAKETPAQYSQPSSAMHPTHMPLGRSWPNESSTSTTIVSNMLSVSVESVQVHSSSFAFGSPMGSPHYPIQPPALVGPHMQNPFGVPMMRPPYGLSNDAVPYPVPSPTGFAAQPEIPGLAAPPYPENVTSASTEFQPCLPISAPPHVPHTVEPAPSLCQSSSNTVEPQSILRKQLDILMSTVVTNPDSCSVFGKLGNNSASRIQPSVKATSVPANTRTSSNLLSCEISTKELLSTSSQPTNQLLSEAAPNLRNVRKDALSSFTAAKTFRSSTQAAMNQSSVQVTEETVGTVSNNSPCKLSPSSPHIEKSSEKVTSRTTHSVRKEALVQSHCTFDSNVTDKSVKPGNCPLNSNSSKSSIQEPVKLSAKEDLKQVDEEIIIEDEEEVIIEEYDSDIIVEEPPPKPPVELICISGDEADENKLVGSEEGDDEIYKFDDVEPEGSVAEPSNAESSSQNQASAEPPCEGRPTAGPPSNSANSSKTVPSNVDPAIEKLRGKGLSVSEFGKLSRGIRKGKSGISEPSKTVPSNVEPVSVEPQGKGLPIAEASESTSGSRKRKSRSKRRRNRNHRSSSRNRRSDGDMEQNKKYRTEVEDLQDHDEVSDSGADFVKRECRAMIDSLRIGRFVVIEEDKLAQPAPSADSSSKSPLSQSSVHFSYTKSVTPAETPTSKDASTNTPIRLCIDVCTGTENTGALKDSTTQTDLCLDYMDQKDLIREMNAQILSLKKERDELLKILDIKKSQTLAVTIPIPGLDLPTSDDPKSSGNKLSAGKIPQFVLNSSDTNIRPESVLWHNATLKPVTPEKASSTSSEISEAAFNGVLSGEPILAYDYNHASPVRPGPRVESYLSKKPFQ